MATYKSEFLAHYYAHRMRPRTAYAFGLIDRWARIAAHAPGLVNMLGRAPLTSTVAKALAGIASTRALPAFASETFQHRFARKTRARAMRAAGADTVLLWPDTFNNHFHPESALAAANVLETAGFDVRVPSAPVCCGRPLYDFGMLERAQRYLRRILDAFEHEIDGGTPFVVLEPACASVFRDELVNLFPGDEVAKRLSRQTFLLAEFLAQRAPGFDVPHVAGRALVHGHCHHKAVMSMRPDETLLRKTGLDVRMLDAGCCGMAGSFGFARDTAALSIAIGELRLLPAVRAAPADTLLVADGFSCREQIAQCTGRHALHLAEVLEHGLTNGRREGRAPAPAAHKRVRETSP
jgi:Fe-S oxidoreductase